MFYRVRRIFVFTLVFITFFVEITILLHPIWLNWSNYDTTQGFYNEPSDLLEVVVLGTSQIMRGVIPIQLYEEYGICAYNLSTAEQPMMASYYWLREAYRMHSESLKKVIVCCSSLKDSFNDSLFELAVMPMHISRVKYDALQDYYNNPIDGFFALQPVYSYHNRWNTLEKDDFIKTSYRPQKYLRGYNFHLSQYLDSGELGDWNDLVREADRNVDAVELDSEAVDYFRKIKEFCDEKNLELLMIAMPTLWWSSAYHNAMEQMAEECSVDFLDFNCEPLISEMDYNLALDNENGGWHLNYYGAQKVTSVLGRLLSEDGSLSDVRENPQYDYLKDQLCQYHAMITDAVRLQEEKDPVKYLSLAIEGTNNTVFISAKDECTTNLSAVQKKCLTELGLVELAELGYSDSYLAVIENGNVTVEMSQSATESAADSVELLSYTGKLDGHNKYQIKSGGYSMGNLSSCVINGVEYSPNSRGLNFVVFNNDTQKVVDACCFDTYQSSTRDSGYAADELAQADAEGKTFSELPERLQKLYLYNRKCEMTMKAKHVKQNLTKDGFWDYLMKYWNDGNLEIFLSVQDDAEYSFDTAVRSVFSQNGLAELATLEFRDSYVAVISGGKVLYELRDHGEVPIEENILGVQISSGGMDSGNVSSVVINGTDYSPKGRGINVVIYDSLLDMVIDTASFDTYEVPVRITQ